MAFNKHALLGVWVPPAIRGDEDTSQGSQVDLPGLLEELGLARQEAGSVWEQRGALEPTAVSTGAPQQGAGAPCSPSRSAGQSLQHAPTPGSSPSPPSSGHAGGNLRSAQSYCWQSPLPLPSASQSCGAVTTPGACSTCSVTCWPPAKALLTPTRTPPSEDTQALPEAGSGFP